MFCCAGFQKTLRSSSMSLEDRYDVFVFDCDGVLWSGDEAIAGAADVIRRLQALGKQIFFCHGPRSSRASHCPVQ